jgi:alpha/beta hydrolase fold
LFSRAGYGEDADGSGSQCRYRQARVRFKVPLTLTDGLAQGRPVILFNNAGVASSSGETPNTVDAMGDHVAAFVNALGLPQVDVLGFSIGGYVAPAFFTTPAAQSMPTAIRYSIWSLENTERRSLFRSMDICSNHIDGWRIWSACVVPGLGAVLLSLRQPSI